MGSWALAPPDAGAAGPRDRPVPNERARVMAKPDVSVIVPFWGVEDTVAECLESLLAQDHAAIEVICVDDRSPDRSRGIVERYAARDARVRILTHAENQGLGLSRNTGVAEAEGEFLLFLDSDDRMSSPSAVRALLRAAIDTGSELVAGSAVYLDAAGRISPYDRAWDRRYEGQVIRNLPGPAAYSALIRMPGANYLPLRSWGWLIDAAFYRSLGVLHPKGVHEDIGHNALVASAARNVHYCEEIVVDYRVRPGSISNTTWSANRMDSYLGVWAHFRDHHPGLGLDAMVGNAALHVIRNCCWMLRKNGVTPGDEPGVLDRIGGLMEEVDANADPEMLSFVTRLLHEVLREIRVPPGSLAWLLARLPAEAQMSGAYHDLGVRRQFRRRTVAP